MNVLVLNAGSSTLKFQLVRTDEARVAANTDEKLARATIERIGGEARAGGSRAGWAGDGGRAGAPGAPWAPGAAPPPPRAAPLRCAPCARRSSTRSGAS